MASYCKVIIVGNLTRDPEMRVTPKGTAICSFGIAVNRPFKDESGQSRDEVTFVDVEAWEKKAELCSKYLKKGSQLLVDGRLKMDQWEDKASGQKRSKLKVVLENMTFLGSREPGEGGDGGSAQPPERKSTHSTPPSRNPPPPTASQENIDEDVPF